MAEHQHVGAAAPRPVTPARCDNARLQPGVEGKGTTDSGDCAVKQAVSATARAALLGIEAHQLEGGAWLLRHARGAAIGVVHGLDALDAAVAGFEAAQRDVRELVLRMRSAT